MKSFTHAITVRYGECDMQRVVFNANYFAYCDDVVDTWMRQALKDRLSLAGTRTDLSAIGFDFMLKTASLTWIRPVVFGEVIDMSAHVSRWGRTSFEVQISGSVDGEARFDASIVYVSVDPSTHRPVAIPSFVHVALDGQPPQFTH